MRIKALELHGFKSFADRTRVELHGGITAIVGPNGCGKSNISDALRWVLGEQRPTAIRGSRMEEAIFGGSKGRSPIHRAEVTLELSNEDRTLPLPYTEVVIGRTVYRGGESDYALNGESCRLKDIQDLCRDTGLGANAYAMIESRMIDSILSDRAEERRALFEEAAEIGRYKDRRRTALRRLEQAEGDLRRLDDVMGEVRSKVRSLAQQRGRAERHRRLRQRRLRLEVAVARALLADTEERLEAARTELEELRGSRTGEEAELQTAETQAEALRVRLAERERDRSAAAGELEAVRRRLEERERERLVASERKAASETRLRRIAEELERLEARREEVAGERERAEARRSEERRQVDDLAARALDLRAEVDARAEARRTAEEAEEAARVAAEGAARELGQLEAAREGASERVAERTAELDRRRRALEETRARTAELAERLEETGGAAEEAGTRAAGVEAELAAAREGAEARRAACRELRETVAELEGELSAARARRASLDGFLASGGDLPGAVARFLDELGGEAGIEGPLAGFVRAEPELAAAVEAHLGPYLHGVVVRDWAAVERARAWLRGHEEAEGLLLLPLDPGPRAEGPSAGPDRDAGPDGGADADASLLDRIEARGAGAPWVRALLAGVRLRDGDEPAPADGAWVGPDGSGQDAAGAVRLGAPGAGRGSLRRRAELEEVAARVVRLENRLDGARAELAREEEELQQAVTRGEELERRRREAADELGALEAERESTAGRLARAREEAEEIQARIAELEEAREEARERADAGADRIEGLREARARAEEGLEAARSRTAAAREAWEAKRTELHDLQLAQARREADLEAAADTVRRATSTLEELSQRAERLREEHRAQEEAIDEARRTLEEGEASLAALFEERRELEARLREAEERLEVDREELRGREEALREARRRERERTERRHELELEVSELRARRAGVRDRLEAEWDAPLEELSGRTEPPEEGDLDAWQEELDGVRRRLQRLGPVNLLAEEEYEEERERLEFLEEQREDLVEARDDLQESIRRINRTAAEAFRSTFEEIRENFRATFQALFEGGECDLWLEDPEDPLDSPVEISASPRGKRTQRIHLLSGGERALTALALLFAIYRTKPSPFCLMDEVDAPLDEANILRFVGMLERFKDDTQFIVITHNPRTIEAADYIYGVTMQEPGVSSVVGVTFDEAADRVA